MTLPASVRYTDFAMRDDRDQSSPVHNRPVVRIETLGCKVNQADSDVLAVELQRAGCRVASEDESADVCVVNTCTVTHVADAKARKLIRKLARDHPRAAIIVTGCYAERAGAEVAEIPGVAHVVPNTGKGELAGLVRRILCNANSAAGARGVGFHPHPDFSVGGDSITQISGHTGYRIEATSRADARRLMECGNLAPTLKAAALPPHSKGPRADSFDGADAVTKHAVGNDKLEGSGVHCAQMGAGPRPARPGSVRAFVTVQDGCNHRCAYCIVPDVRGPMRSQPIPDVVAQIRDRAAAGAREVVICGIRLGAYAEQGAGRGLAELVRAVRAAPVARLRLSSIEPWEVSDCLIAEMAGHPLLCAHLHLPLQSGDDGILRAMGRRYRLRDYRALVDRLRDAMPGVAVTTDLMVGFPGESDAAFANTLRAVDDIGFARAHVFRYSPRPGTRAAAMAGQVPEPAKARRAARLAHAADESARRFAERLVGHTVDVLFEECAGGHCSGLTDTYVAARVPGEPSLVGRVAGVEVCGVECIGITGKVLHGGGDARSLPAAMGAM
jgi:MiaB-like tRNA modifying enzyme